jgi:3-dehydroquinate dehydratase-1/3-dehydroquinate dehydratase/shikimate dehydrogenase
LKVELGSPAGICVSIACENTAEAVRMAKQSEDYADVIEIRLDRLVEPATAPFIGSLRKPVLFTNRPVWEGGGFEGPEGERVALLLAAIKSGCALVDLELKAAPELRAEVLDVLLTHDQTGLIISWHDFASTPSSEELGEILEQQMESGAHIGKIVTMAHNYDDVLRVLNLQTFAAENNFPLIAFCMGGVGMISRIATLKLGGYMTYGAPEGGEESAPGQVGVAKLHAMLKIFGDRK